MSGTIMAFSGSAPHTGHTVQEPPVLGWVKAMHFLQANCGSNHSAQLRNVLSDINICIALVFCNSSERRSTASKVFWLWLLQF